jgi:fructoselysine 6-kinase
MMKEGRLRTFAKIKWLCIGDVGQDIYHLEGEGKQEKKFAGGISLNHLVHLHRLGERDLSFSGPLSQHKEDQFLSEKLNQLEIKKINCELLEGRVPQQRIALRANGEKNFIGYEAGILEAFTYQQPTEVFDWILMPVFEQNWSWSKKVLEDPPQGHLVCDFLDGRDFHQDLSFLEDFASQIDLLVIGCPPEDEGFYKDIFKNIGKWSKKVLVTRGALTGFYFDGSKLCHFNPVAQKSVVDTTGAGDAFLSSFLASLSRGHFPEEALELASVYAGRQLLRLGPH